MISLIVIGILYGLLMASMIGPVFFALIRTSIEKGFWAGALLAIGISASESLAIFVSYSCVVMLKNNLADSLFFKTAMGLMGGGLMLLFGIYTFFNKSGKIKMDDAKNRSLTTFNWDFFKYAGQGFLLNVLNPFVYLFWMGWISTVMLESNYSLQEILVIFSTTISVILLTDLIKAYIAEKISYHLSESIMERIDKGVGVILFGFGFRLICFGLFGI